MKKAFGGLRAGTLFKFGKEVYIKDSLGGIVCLTSGEFAYLDDPEFALDAETTLVTVCKRIRKSDIKERK